MPLTSHIPVSPPIHSVGIYRNYNRAYPFELRKLCIQRGLPHHGNKIALVVRLTNADLAQKLDDLPSKREYEAQKAPDDMPLLGVLQNLVIDREYMVETAKLDHAWGLYQEDGVSEDYFDYESLDGEELKEMLDIEDDGKPLNVQKRLAFWKKKLSSAEDQYKALLQAEAESAAREEKKTPQFNTEELLNDVLRGAEILSQTTGETPEIMRVKKLVSEAISSNKSQQVTPAEQTEKSQNLAGLTEANIPQTGQEVEEDIRPDDVDLCLVKNKVLPYCMSDKFYAEDRKATVIGKGNLWDVIGKITLRQHNTAKNSLKKTQRNDKDGGCMGGNKM